MEIKSQLPPSVIQIWRIYGLIELVIFGLLLVALVIFSLIWNWPFWISGALLALIVVYSSLRITTFPKIRWNHFFYEIKDDEIDIQDGIFIIRRTLVPIVKIQKVYISQGPLLKKHNLANVTIYTAASEETIPGLPYSAAEDIRNYIGKLVKVSEEDE